MWSFKQITNVIKQLGTSSSLNTLYKDIYHLRMYVHESVKDTSIGKYTL